MLWHPKNLDPERPEGWSWRITIIASRRSTSIIIIRGNCFHIVPVVLR